MKRSCSSSDENLKMSRRRRLNDGTAVSIEEILGEITDTSRLTMSKTAEVQSFSHVDRSYQLEMYLASLQKNVIVCMGTGTGKTHVAKLRIEEELRRNPEKRIWITCPNVVLAEQQHLILKAHLPSYNHRTLLGHDKVDLWSTSKIWNEALEGIDIVTSTPQVLLDALSHAFVKLSDLSLLVIDEAHHAVANAPSARIMHHHYHHSVPKERPHILALTASARISEKSASMETLEQTLDAMCITPTTSVEEYDRYVYRAQMVALSYTPGPPIRSMMLSLLQKIVNDLTLDEDPDYKKMKLKALDNLHAQSKLTKMKNSGMTGSMKQIRSLMTNTDHLLEQLGPWASDRYIVDCVTAWNEMVIRNETLDIMSFETQQHINSKVARIRELEPITGSENAVQSVKLRILINYLAESYFEGIAIIIFVERRSTASALCKVLQNSPKLSKYRVFPFVGLSSARSGGLSDVANKREQQAAFEQFRSGSQDICIATSVAEEGIDIQAVNVVIRFDDPKQFVSYLQSRGRARQQESKYVYFKNTEDDDAKYASFAKFERQLEDDYKQARAEREEMECSFSDDEADEWYTVANTGASLSKRDAKASLQHICAVVSQGTDGPAYLLTRNLGSLQCHLVLPARFPSELRSFKSVKNRRSERSVNNDVAFEAVKALHKAGLINDHLLPYSITRESPQQVGQFVEPQVVIPPQIPVWEKSKDDGLLLKYRVTVTIDGNSWDSVIMILSQRIKESIRFTLKVTNELEAELAISPVGEISLPEYQIARRATKNMFGYIFCGKDGGVSESFDDQSSITFAILPDQENLDPSMLTDEPINLIQYQALRTSETIHQPLLLWKPHEAGPYLWHSSTSHIINESSHIKAVKIKRLGALGQLGVVNNSGKLRSQSIPTSTCTMRHLSSRYGVVLMLIPDILKKVENTLRAQKAQEKFYHNLPTSILSQALNTRMASDSFNYERLEFFGDALLKFRISLMLFGNDSQANSGALTYQTSQLVSNHNLIEIAQRFGIAQFITTHDGVLGARWTLPKITSNPQNREIASKTLADVIESTLATAYLCGSNADRGYEACTSILSMYFPETIWPSPTELALKTILDLQPTSPGDLSLVDKFKRLTSYTFNQPPLLVQALTHSSHNPASISYDRLEYLGDAILDFIIAKKLWSYSNMNPGDMTTAKSSLVSHKSISYWALCLDIVKFESKITAGENGIADSTQPSEKLCLTDLIKTASFDVRNSVNQTQERLVSCRREISVLLESGVMSSRLFDSLEAPKVCSDIVESCLAAIYIDAGGSLEPCERFVDKLGITSMLERMYAHQSLVADTINDPESIISPDSDTVQHLTGDESDPQSDVSDRFIDAEDLSTDGGVSI